MLAIADAEAAQAVGGVIGGASSEVSPATRRVALESAYFTPSSIRRTSRRLGSKTEASARFERGANIEAPAAAMRRARSLLQEIGAGTPKSALIDVYPEPKFQHRTVGARSERIDALLGHPIDPAFVPDILSRLGFSAARDSAAETPRWMVTVPPWRVDVTREVDLIEEVGRHHGYDHVTPRFPPLAVAPAPPDGRLVAERVARRVLSAAGFSEAITYAFIERPAALALGEESRLVALANPLSEKLAVLRPSVLAGVLESIGHNRRRERRDVQLYEIGSRFDLESGETRAVAFAWTGAAAPHHWSGPARPVDFFDVKGVVERFCEAFGIGCRFEPIVRRTLVRGRSAAILAETTAGQAELGYVGQLDPAIADARDLPPADEIYVGELNLDRIAADMTSEQALRVDPLARFPSIVRDLSIVVDEALPAADVRGTIRAAAPATLVSVMEFDRYLGTGIPQGSISLSLRLTFRSPDRTLTDAEVDAATGAIVEALESRHGARRR
jgi:phenylalanyl-tRNA synthetase beta chain